MTPLQLRAKRIWYKMGIKPKHIVRLVQDINPLAIKNSDKISDEQIEWVGTCARLFSGLGDAISNYIRIEKTL